MIPEPIKRFIEAFSSLPGIGMRQATRLAFKLTRSGERKITEIAEAANGLESLGICTDCFFPYQEHISSNDNGLCPICKNPNRNPRLIIIVEKETDLISIEKTGKFSGRYLVLGEMSKTGVFDNLQKVRLNRFKKTLSGIGKADEIIIAINPNTYGDINASLISAELRPCAQKITRLGRGIPTGGEIEFADEETLAHAIQNRN